MSLTILLFILLSIIIGVAIGYFVAKNVLTNQQIQARTTADFIVAEANKEAESLKKEKLLEAKEEYQRRNDRLEEDYRKDVQT